MCHGGMRLSDVSRLIAAAQGRASSKERSDIGAAPPGQWQDWQCFSRMGAMSLENVGAVCPSDTDPVNVRMTRTAGKTSGMPEMAASA